jgi:hypothetical protein
MLEIERKYIELYGEFNLTTKDPAYRVFKDGWKAGSQLTRLDDAEIEQLLLRVTIEADEINLLYVTETGMKVFARQIERLLKEKNT